MIRYADDEWAVIVAVAAVAGLKPGRGCSRRRSMRLWLRAGGIGWIVAWWMGCWRSCGSIGGC